MVIGMCLDATPKNQIPPGELENGRGSKTAPEEINTYNGSEGNLYYPIAL